MTKVQKSRINMFDAVLLLLMKHLGIIATLPALQANFNTFRLKLANIHAAEEVNKTHLKGYSTDKKAMKKLLIHQFSINGAQLAAYAFNIGNNKLRETVDFSISELKKKGQADITTAGNIILKLLLEHLDKLADYGIDGASLDVLKQLLASYELEKPAYRNASAGRSTWVKIRKEEFSAIGSLLRLSVDKLMLNFKDSHPDLYMEYKSNRKVINIGPRQTKASGTITSKQTGKPLHKATATAVEVNTGVVFETVSNVRGNFNLKITDAGTYRFVVSHPDHLSSPEELFTISRGEQVKRDVVLEPKMQ